MNRYKWMIGGLLALALGIVVYTFVGPKRTDMSEEGGSQPAIAHLKGDQRKAVSSAHDTSVQGASTVAKRANPEIETTKGRGQSSVSGAVKEERNNDQAKAAAAEKAVNAWESLVDKLAESKEVPTKETKDGVKEAFDNLDKADQMDAIQRSLNLLPDEQFTSLFGILYDKTENPAVLDAIFSDALNRPEEIKVPMMKDFLFDKKHPMFVEAARILDATGELDKMVDGDSGTTAESETETTETTVDQK